MMDKRRGEKAMAKTSGAPRTTLTYMGELEVWSERPTMHLRWNGSSLEQAWVVERGRCLSAFPEESMVDWRAVPMKEETNA